MFEELFLPLNAPLPDAGPYLERLGITVTRPDKETLDRLVFAHQTRIPFENLEIYDADRDIPIGIPALYDKIVTRHRGGYCFELNAALMALLKAVGYQCHAVAARVVWNNELYMPVTHRATVVTLDGTRYFCDVGFGGPSPRGALSLDTLDAQPIGPDVFRLTHTEHGTVTNRELDGGLERLLMFSETPVDPVDFLACNFYQSKFPDSFFRRDRLVNLTTENGSISITGNVLKIREGDKLTETTLSTEAELKAALKEYFGIVVDYSLRI